MCTVSVPCWTADSPWGGAGNCGAITVTGVLMLLLLSDVSEMRLLTSTVAENVKLPGFTVVNACAHSTTVDAPGPSAGTSKFT